MEGGLREKEATKDEKCRHARVLVEEREPNKEGKPGRQNKRVF